MKTNYANFYFRSLCIKLVALRMNLCHEAALSFKKFGHPALSTNLSLTPNIKPRVYNLGCMYPLA